MIYKNTYKKLSDAKIKIDVLDAFRFEPKNKKHQQLLFDLLMTMPNEPKFSSKKLYGLGLNKDILLSHSIRFAGKVPFNPKANIYSIFGKEPNNSLLNRNDNKYLEKLRKKKKSHSQYGDIARDLEASEFNKIRYSCKFNLRRKKVSLALITFSIEQGMHGEYVFTNVTQLICKISTCFESEKQKIHDEQSYHNYFNRDPYSFITFTSGQDFSDYSENPKDLLVVEPKIRYLVCFFQTYYGQDIYRYLQSKRITDNLTKRFLFEKIVEKVLGMHNQGIVHEDIKPDNFVTENGSDVRIVDFERSCKNGKKNDYIYPELYYLYPEDKYDKQSQNLQICSYEDDVYQLGLSFASLLLYPFIGIFNKVKEIKNQPLKEGKAEFTEKELIVVNKNVRDLVRERLQERKCLKDEIELINKMLSFDPKQRPTLQKVSEKIKGINARERGKLLDKIIEDSIEEVKGCQEEKSKSPQKRKPFSEKPVNYGSKELYDSFLSFFNKDIKSNTKEPFLQEDINENNKDLSYGVVSPLTPVNFMDLFN